MTTEPVLEIADLTVAYRQGEQWLPAVRDFSLRFAPGETVGLVGESGSNPNPRFFGDARLHRRRAIRGAIVFQGRDYWPLTPAMRAVWKRPRLVRRIASALNPSSVPAKRRGLRLHLNLSRDDRTAGRSRC